MSVAGVPSQPGRPGFAAERIAAAGSAIDALMERASQALVRCDYFATIELSLRALDKARRSKDFERIARVVLPLQEARRQVRQLACDAGRTFVWRSLPGRDTPMEPGLHLLEPPMIGLEGRAFREIARARKVPALVLVKEPTTGAGKWPIVGVGLGEFENVVARVQVDPPTALKDNRDKSIATVPPEKLPGVEWFLAAQEAVGDAAICKVRPSWPAAHRVEDLIEYLDAVPDHEKLSQALEAAAREALASPLPINGRRRPAVDNPFSF
jgi:hypothetical protein